MFDTCRYCRKTAVKKVQRQALKNRRVLHFIRYTALTAVKYYNSTKTLIKEYIYKIMYIMPS